MRQAGNILLALFTLLYTEIAAQDLTVHGSTPDLYLIHTVEKGETWYALGRTYNLAPRDITVFNRLSLESGLQVGQQVKIPLLSVNFSQNEIKASDEVFVPLYHTVQPREWLYRISQNHNKVPVETIERWNNIKADDAVAGTRLIIGYLKVKQTQSALASKARNISNPLASNRQQPPVQPAPQPVQQVNEAPRPANTPVEGPKKESASAASEQPAPQVVSNTPAAQPNTPIPQGGYFRNQFKSNGKKTSGIAGVFKSTSGWKDGKYYALMNDVPVGTIIRVNFPSTNRTIFAKVLGELPDMRESEGMTLRLSDAAASELGGGYQKFTVEVRY